jgi:hypothetical protein
VPQAAEEEELLGKLLAFLQLHVKQC